MTKLNALRAGALTKPGTYCDGGGLYLQVRGADQRSWLFRFKSAGRGRLMGLGPFPDVSLAEAREAATAARKALRGGVDPIDHRRTERAEAAAQVGLNTFGEVAKAYIAAHEAGWRNAKHRGQWRTTIDTYAAPVIGRLPVATIATGHITRILEPIWREKPETASRLRGRIESVLDYATSRGWRTGENPARWRGHLDNLLPSRAKIARVEHHAALPWQQIGAFWADLAEQEGVSALALRFAILTAARTGEVINSTWAEIDTQAAVWTVPAARMKAGREHRVPLSAPALAVLSALAPMRDDAAGGWVFPGQRARRPLSQMAMLMLLRRMGHEALTAHGFRSTFRDWAGEATSYDRDTAEAALAHTLRDKVEAAYRRGDLFDKRRRLMDAWAEFCARPAISGAAGVVVPLHLAVNEIAAAA